jgi:ectoine hydroxylase-related dioxygenase (phytanoyl-CoA dioxygenase family)
MNNEEKLELSIKDNIDEFINDGVTVFEDVFSDDEIDAIREQFHDQLRSIDIDHEKILSGETKPSPDVRIKAKPSRIFYNKWKIDAHTNPKVYRCIKALMNRTFSTGVCPGFEHPMGESTDILAYIDRICYRTPDHIRAEGGLGLHLDRNPIDPYLLESNGLKMWRPIQAFIALTDQYGSESGGLRVVRGFHNEIDEYFSNGHTEDVNDKGCFFRLNSKSHAKLEKRCQPVNVRRGSIVCWDNRLPHATAQKFTSHDTREVIYIGYLPNVKLNIKYIKDQLNHINQNIAPPAYYDDPTEHVDRNWNDCELTPLQKQLLGFNLQ